MPMPVDRAQLPDTAIQDPCLDGDLAALGGEFYGIGQEIDEDLAEAARIGCEMLGHGRNIDRKRDAALLGPAADEINAIIHRLQKLDRLK